MAVNVLRALIDPANPPTRNAGSSPLVAELDEELLASFPEFRLWLERFGVMLAQQMATRYTRPVMGAVVGVELRSIEFSLVLDPAKKT